MSFDIDISPGHFGYDVIVSLDEDVIETHDVGDFHHAEQLAEKLESKFNGDKQ